MARFVELEQRGLRHASSKARISRFVVPPISVLEHEPPPPPAQGRKLDLVEIYRRTSRRLTEAVREYDGDDGTPLVGWSHRLDDSFVSVIGTAYGLLITDMLEPTPAPVARKKDRMVSTLLAVRTADGGWAASSQGAEHSQVEATAWVTMAMHAAGRAEETDAAVAALERAADQARDSTLQRLVFPLSLVLRVLARVAPGSPLLARIAQLLIQSAALTTEGAPFRWSRRAAAGLSDSGRGEVVRASVLHTAHAIVSLAEANAATDGAEGLSTQELGAARDWLLAEPRWDNIEETIRRPIPNRPRTASATLRVQHFTAPWIVSALLLAGTDADHPKVRRVITSILDAEDDGLWNWGDVPHPIWATHDALNALRLFAMRGGRM